METQKNSSVDLDLYVQNGKFTNLQESEEINSITFSYSNMKEKMLCFYSGETFTDEDEKPVTGKITKNLGKKVKIIWFYSYYFSIFQFCFHCLINANLFN